MQPSETHVVNLDGRGYIWWRHMDVPARSDKVLFLAIFRGMPTGTHRTIILMTTMWSELRILVTTQQLQHATIGDIRHQPCESRQRMWRRGVIRRCRHMLLEALCAVSTIGHGSRTSAFYRRAHSEPSTCIRLYIGSILASGWHVHCAGMGVPVLKMTASERRSF